MDSRVVRKAMDSREESVLSVADKVIFLSDRANIGDGHLVVEDGGGDEAGDDGTVDLNGWEREGWK